MIFHTFKSMQGNRKQNLDKFVKFIVKDMSVFLMLDGFQNISNHVHFVDFFIKHIEKNILACSDLNEVIELLNKTIKIPTTNGKASIAILIMAKSSVFYATLGDVRIYFIPNNVRTIDDSHAQWLVTNNIIREQSINHCSFRHSLTRSIPTKTYSFNFIKISHVEKIIMCTDGFWSCFNEHSEIFNIKTKKDLDNIFDLFIENNLQDNTSAALIELKI